MLGFLGSFPPARIAVSLLFLCNGLLIGAWAPMIPIFKERLELTGSEMGLVILALGVGSLVSMTIVGALVSKIGTRMPIIYNSILLGIGLPALALAPDFISAILIMLILGAFLSGMDVSMNSNVIEVERNRKIVIMSSCHGFWSLGGIIGAFLGGKSLVIFGEQGHTIVWMCIYYLLLIYALLNIETNSVSKEERANNKVKIPRSILPFLLGLVAFFSVVPEGVVIDWGALYLKEERGFMLAHAGYGYAANAAAMALMRFFGDNVRQTYGSVRTLQVCLTLSILGFVIILFAPNSIITITGFFVAGLGMSNLFPIAISAAGNLPNVPSALSVSFVASIGYAGILLAPPLFGFIAQTWDYTIVFTIMPICLMVVFFFIYPARYADIPKDGKEA